VNDVATLGIITLLAFSTPLIAGRVRIPAVVLEVLAGLIFGHYLGLIYYTEWLNFFATFGLIFLMFLSGLEIDFALLRRNINSTMTGIIYFCIAFTAAILITNRLGLDLLFAIILMTTSVGVVLPTLREIGITGKSIGQQILISAIIADVATMTILTSYAVGIRTGKFSYEIFLVIGIFAAFFMAYYAGRYIIWYFPEFISRWFTEDPMEIGVRGSLAIMISFVGLAYLIGVEAILGAFLAGALLSILFRGGKGLNEKLYGMGYGFLIPFFFISVGAKLNPETFYQSNLGLLVTLLILAFSVKIISSLINTPFFGFRNSVGIGILLATQFSLVIAGASIGYDLGLIDENEEAAIVFFAIISCLLYPTIYRLFFGKIDKKITEAG
jgi:Kef-type K+ transport system membrane component KefB